MIDFITYNLLNVKIFAASCQGNFFGLPVWYKYLSGADTCQPEITHINDIWLVLLAVIELLIRIAIAVAIIYVLIGGFKYITSRGMPDKTATAKNTIIDGLVGLVIAIVATTVIGFVASRFN